MSGSPKYTRAELEERRRREIEAERRRQAEEERRRRAQAAARETTRRLKEARQRARSRSVEVRALLDRRAAELYPQDLERLRSDLSRLGKTLETATSEDAVRRAEREMEGLLSQAAEGAARRRREEQERRQREELERLGWEVEECRRRLGEVSDLEAQRFDDPGRTQAREAVSAAGRAVEARELPAARNRVAEARRAVESHVGQARDARARWMVERDAARAALGQAEAMLVGLGEDPVAVRWQMTELEHLRQEQLQLAARLDAEAFGEVQEGVRSLLEREADLVDAANRAQLQADQRDAIADSVRGALEQMGFFVSHPRPEHPGHPATALLLEARSAAGRAIGVSVPVDGEIWYEMDGYARTSVAVAGGGTASACDEAEKALLDLHRILGEAYGVQAGDILWEGKDPNRNLRKADDLPTTGRAQARGTTR